MKCKKRKVFLFLTAWMALFAAGCGLFKDFDAEGYVRALLNQTFGGEVKEAAKVMGDTSEEELKEQYEEEISTFVRKNLVSGIQMDDAVQKEYESVCKEIFRAMKYEVKGSEKTDKKEYDVSVEIQPSDIFIKFTDAVKEDSRRLMEKADKGEYQGTESEISSQMQKEFVADALELLKQARSEMQYGEKETVIIKVTGNKNNEFTVDEEEISNLITKILRLDEIQG